MKLRLTESQERVVGHEEGALLVVAGPGSGKTRVLTERIKRLLEDDAQHFRVLALTFTNKAANEMLERLKGLPGITERAFIGTMHSFCTEALANRGKSVGIEGMPNIVDSFQDRKQALQDAASVHPDLKQALTAEGDPKARSRKLDQWLKEIGEYKNNLIAPEMIQDEQFQRLYAGYNNQLRASNAVDFDDLLFLTYRLFEERPKIAAFYRRQYRYICVDEAQDLNEAQYRVLCALCGSDYFNVMMVGDPKQAIFMWNGAHPKYLDLFEKDFGATKIELLENFRCSRQIVAAAQKLDPNYDVEGVLAVEGVVHIEECDDEASEAEFVVSTIERLVEEGHPDVEGGICLERCAIIGRNRFVFRETQDLLKSRNVAFHKKTGGSGVQSESDIVGEFELSLRMLANPLDRLHLGLLMKRWSIMGGVEAVYGDSDLRKLTGEELLRRLQSDADDHASPVFDALEALGWASQEFRLTKGLDVVERFSAALDTEQRAMVLEDIAEWRKHWNFYVRSERGAGQSIQGFLSQVALGTTQQPSESGVALLSVHSAKGMEFDIVFLIGMTEGTFPDFRAKGSAMEEEKRNAFVAITRSRRLLYISYPNKKLMPWGDMKNQQPSRFVSELDGP